MERRTASFVDDGLKDTAFSSSSVFSSCMIDHVHVSKIRRRSGSLLAAAIIRPVLLKATPFTWPASSSNTVVSFKRPTTADEVS